MHGIPPSDGEVELKKTGKHIALSIKWNGGSPLPD
jgi:hypothetical protein